MIDTELILIEGVPCSGKSTTAKNLMTAISACGIKCQCFLEWAENNPIFIGKMEELSDIISTTKSREQHVLRDWKNFTKKAKHDDTVTVIESRFWQTDAMYLYLSGHSEYDVAKSNQRIISVISELHPVLIYLAPEDMAQLFTPVAEVKNKEWRESGREGSWEQWGNAVYERQTWFTHRSLKGSNATHTFFNEWVSMAERLYEGLPFRKIKIQNPQADWERTMGTIRDFLKMNR
ncbi:hypothetical protein [Desulfospira joergensenii]|uniref:hypothetical protein n=1 Tax=Desulfospira joergensenii TaxID=53329 RepID=UPI0003B71A08|nr:hypothetical protein [Desulfospira joergensenii]